MRTGKQESGDANYVVGTHRSRPHTFRDSYRQSNSCAGRRQIGIQNWLAAGNRVDYRSPNEVICFLEPALHRDGFRPIHHAKALLLQDLAGLYGSGCSHIATCLWPCCTPFRELPADEERHPTGQQ